MITKRMEQSGENWLEWRRQGIGASDISAIMGVNPYKRAAQVYDEKKHDVIEMENSAMRRGKDYEGEALETFRCWYKAHVQNFPGPQDFFVPCCVEEEEGSIFRASLDGYFPLNRQVVEIKVPGEKSFEKMKKEIPIYYLYQLQWQMMITGSLTSYFCAYNPDTLEIFVESVTADQALHKKMREAAEKFWDDFLLDIRPVDKKDTLFLFDDESTMKMKKLLEIKEEIRLLETQAKTIQSQLLSEFGDEMSLEGVDCILMRSERSSTDYRKACLDAKLDLSLYEKPKTVSWTIKIK